MRESTIISTPKREIDIQLRATLTKTAFKSPKLGGRGIKGREYQNKKGADGKTKHI
jgi:hypothetical protein